MIVDILLGVLFWALMAMTIIMFFVWPLLAWFTLLSREDMYGTVMDRLFGYKKNYYRGYREYRGHRGYGY
jgi:hypothetical protein